MRRAVAIGVAVMLTTTGGYLYGQQKGRQPLQFVPPPTPPANIRTGADIGFRVDRMEQDRASVTLMIRTKSGEWVQARLSSEQLGLVPLESR